MGPVADYTEKYTGSRRLTMARLRQHELDRHTGLTTKGAPKLVIAASQLREQLVPMKR